MTRQKHENNNLNPIPVIRTPSNIYLLGGGVAAPPKAILLRRDITFAPQINNY